MPKQFSVDLRYWSSAAFSFARHSRRRGFLADICRAGLRAELEPQAITRFLLDLYPEIESVSVSLGDVTYRRSNLDPMEQFALAAITRLRKPERILEIGTFDGATTLLLARNAPTAEILTLDLPPEQAGSASVLDEQENARGGVGARFAGTPEATRIEQLLGDSRTFDFSPWFSGVDLVLIDGGHDYEYAASDTATAFRLLRPGGVIIWDDYTVGWPGVRQAVDETRRDVVRLAGTDLAIYDDAGRRESADS